jgi:small membrane protein
MFQFIFVFFLLALITFDSIFLPASARRMRRLLALVLVGAGTVALFQAPVATLAAKLGVGRGVDLVMYFVVVVLVREVFLNRARFTQMDTQLTRLVRAEAIRTAQSSAPDQSVTR